VGRIVKLLIAVGRRALLVAAAGIAMAFAALNMDDGVAKQVVFAIGLIIAALARIGFAIERDHVRRQEEKDKGAADRLV
jgi:hypothetical protein